MILGDNMMLLRKKRSLSQADLGKMIGTSGDVIGRYERGDITPSIDVVEKIADALEVSIDYLIGKTKMVLDKETVERLEDISKLPDEKKNYIFNLIDMCLRDFKIRKSFNTVK
jgi:transcriptional regulator with XRE-family HTH domain